MRPEKILICQPAFDGLGHLYRWFIKRHWEETRAHANTHLHPPMWKPHITVCNGKQAVDTSTWGKRNKEIVEFEYGVDLEQHWKFWVLPIRSERLNEIRVEHGLKPTDKLHITIGRME